MAAVEVACQCDVIPKLGQAIWFLGSTPLHGTQTFQLRATTDTPCASSRPVGTHLTLANVFVHFDRRNKITETRLSDSKTTVLKTSKLYWVSLVVHVPPEGGTTTRDSVTNGTVQDLSTGSNPG